jgi:hypothetical protein
MNALAEGRGTAPIHPLSALSLVVADWLATGLNIATGMEAYWAVASGCALLAGLATFSVERMIMHVGLRAALLRAACTAPWVLLPFPFAGSAAALVLLAWALYGWLAQRPRD